MDSISAIFFGFSHHHLHQGLGSGDHDGPIHGQGLVDRQGHVAGSRRHINEQDIQFSPGHVGPELGDRTRQDRAAPDDRLVLVFEQEVNGHDLDPHGGLFGQDAHLAARALRLMPKARGMEGPVISASSTPTFSPRRERRTASIAVTEDLPTPPLPLLTATTFLMLLNSPSLA